MTKSTMRIEIVRSAIKGFSSMSQGSADAVFAVLARHYVRPRITVVNNLADLKALVLRKPDLAFMGMECLPLSTTPGLHGSQKIWVAQYLDEHGIAYTGSAQIAQELGRNKVLAKQQVQRAGLATAPFVVVEQGQAASLEDNSLSFPLFIKPVDRGGGQGIDSDSVVHTIEELRAKAHTITSIFHADSLVEEYLPGREFSVAILQKVYASEYDVMPIELIAPLNAGGTRILGKEIKSSNTEQATIITDPVTKSSITTLALQVFHALGGRDYGRIDIRLNAAGTPHFLEANLIPSLIHGYGSFPKACVLNISLAYEPMILRIVHLGLARHADNIGYVVESVDHDDPIFQLTELVSGQV